MIHGEGNDASPTGRPLRIERIVSGGQTGADRAAWDAALEAGVPIGGWVPARRWAEDGPIPERYGELLETIETDVAVRTGRNVRNADATLLVSHGPLRGGSFLTIECARRLGRPHLHVDLDERRPATVDRITAWIHDHGVRTLNVAGPRASEDPSIYPAVHDLISKLLRRSPARRPAVQAPRDD